MRKVADPRAQFQRKANLDSIHKWKQFTSLINISDLSLVKCFVPKSEELVSEGIFLTVNRQLVVADRLLEREVLDLGVLRFDQARSTQVLGDCLNPHRLSGGAVASVQFRFD